MWCVCAMCSECLYEEEHMYTTSFQVASQGSTHLIKRLVCVVLCTVHIAVVEVIKQGHGTRKKTKQ